MVLIKDAAVKTGITISTAYRFRKTWNDIQEVLEKKKRGRVKVGVLKKHASFIVKRVDYFALMILDHMKKELLKNCPDISISKMQLCSHVKLQYNLNLKKLEKCAQYRNPDETLAKRKATVQLKLDDNNMDFEKNCVFIDETGFNLFINHMRDWSKVSEPEKVEVPKNRRFTISILGTIFSEGVMDISLRKPTLVNGNKKEKQMARL